MRSQAELGTEGNPQPSTLNPQRYRQYCTYSSPPPIPAGPRPRPHRRPRHTRRRSRASPRRRTGLRRNRWGRSAVAGRPMPTRNRATCVVPSRSMMFCSPFCPPAVPEPRSRSFPRVAPVGSLWTLPGRRSPDEVASPLRVVWVTQAQEALKGERLLRNLLWLCIADAQHSIWAIPPL